MFEQKVIPTEVFTLGVDSRYRNLATYPNANSYVIQFDRVYKNVVSLELVLALYEKTTTDQYVNLVLEDVDCNMESNSQYIRKAFTQLPLTQTSCVYDAHSFRSIKIFEKPLAKMAKLTVSFVDPNGGAYPMRDHFLRFEITCMKFQQTAEWKNLDMVSKSVNMFQSSFWNPERVLDLPSIYDWELLENNFKTKARMYAKTDKEKYQECKKAFKELAHLKFNVSAD
jgi:hypothetical protein